MTQFDDDELRAMLEARAGRIDVDPVSVIADGQRRIVASPRASRRIRQPWAALFAACVGVVATLVIVTFTSAPTVGPTGSATVSDDARPTSSPPPIPNVIERAVTADELGRLLAERTVVGHVVAIDGEVVSVSGACTEWLWCERSIVGLTTPHSVLAADSLALASLRSPNPTRGVFALRVRPTSAAGLVGFTLLGRMQADGSTVLWPVETLAGPHQPVDDLVEVTGWIVRTPFHPCPSSPRGNICNPTEDYLTADAFQPVRPDGSVSGPPAETSINLISGSYDDWAPEPARLGSGVEPRRVTLLLRSVGRCGLGPTVRNALTIVCKRPAPDRWIVVARLEPAP